MHHFISAYIYLWKFQRELLPSILLDSFANESIPNNFMPALTSSKSLSLVWNASDTNSLSTAHFVGWFEFDDDFALVSCILFASMDGFGLAAIHSVQIISMF